MDLENRSKRKRSLETRTPRRSPSPGRSESTLSGIHHLFVLYSSFEEALEQNEPLQDHWFKSMLDASKADSLQEKRLSVRLIFSMLPKYRHFSEDCFGPLVYFSTYHPSTRSRREDSLCHKLRVDAIRAFEILWNQAPHLFPKIIRHLLAAVNDQNKTLYGSRVPTGPIAERSPAEVEYRTLLNALEKAMTHNPKCVLEECFRVIEVMDRNFAIGIEVFFQRVLMTPNRPTFLIESILSPSPELTQWCGRAIRSLLNEPSVRSSPESFHRCLLRFRDLVWKVLDAQSWNRRSRSTPRSYHSSTRPPLSSGFRPPPSTRYPTSSRTSSFNASSTEGDFGPVVWFASLPPPMTKENLVDICARYGTIMMIIYPPPGSSDQALVIFQSHKEAFKCCQEVQLCHPSRLFCMNVVNVKKCVHTRVQTSTFLWIECKPCQEVENGILRCLKSAQLPLPRHILRFREKPNGLLLELQTLGVVNQTLSILHEFLNKEPSPVPEQGLNEAKSSPLMDSESASSETGVQQDPVIEDFKKVQESKMWKGNLRVKGKVIGLVECQEGMEKCPAELEMNFTKKLHNVLGLYIGLPPTKRHITPLRSADPAFERLKSYLLKRNKAGVIRTKTDRFYVIPSCSSIRQFLRMCDNDSALFCVRINEYTVQKETQKYEFVSVE